MIFKPALVRTILLGLVLSILPLVSVQGAQANTCSSYKIGFQGPLTGPEAQLGITQLNYVKFAIRKFKAQNPSAPISADVVAADDQGDPSQAAAPAQSLVADPCVLGVVGPSYSGASRVALPIFESAGLSVITPSASNEAIGIEGVNVFNRATRTDRDINMDLKRTVAGIDLNAKIGFYWSDSEGTQNWISTDFSGLEVIRTPLTRTNRATNLSRLQSDYASGVRFFVLDQYLSIDYMKVFAEDVKSIDPSNQVIFFGSQSTPELVKANYVAAFNNSWLFSPSLPLNYVNQTLQNEFNQANRSQDENGNLLPIVEQHTDGELAAFDAATFFAHAIASGVNTRAAVKNFIKTKRLSGLGGNLEFDAIGELEYTTTPRLLVSNGNISIANTSELALNGNLSVSDKTAGASFKFAVMDWDNSIESSYSFISYPNSTKLIASRSTTREIRVPNGTTKIELFPQEEDGGAPSRRTLIEVTAAAGSVTSVIDKTKPNQPITYTKSGDVYQLRLSGFNFVATIAGSNDYSNSMAVIYEVNGSNLNAKYKVPVQDQNKIYANLDTSKTYRIDFYANDQLYQVSPLTTWNNITFNGASTLSYSASPSTSNVTGQVTGVPEEGGTANVWFKNAGNGWDFRTSRSLTSAGYYGFSLTSGAEYRIEIVPNGSKYGPAISEVFTVPNNGAVALATMALSSPNIVGSIAFGNTKFPNLDIWVYGGPNREDYVTSTKTDSAGNFSIFLPIGSYAIQTSSPGYKYKATQNVLCNVTSVTVQVRCDVEIVEENLQGKVTFNNVSQRVMVSAYKHRTSDSDYAGMWDSDFSNDQGEFGMDLGPGTYTLFVDRYVVSSNGDEQLIPQGFSTRCVVTTSPTVCNINLIPNFKFRLTNSQGQALPESANLVLVNPEMVNQVPQESNAENLWATSGAGSTDGIAIPSGTHYFLVANGSYWSDMTTRNFYKVIVTNGVISSVSSLSGTTINPVNGVYALATKEANLSFRPANGTTPISRVPISIQNLEGKGSAYFWHYSNNPVELKLNSGNYHIEIRPRGDEDPVKGVGKYTVSVGSNGIPVVKNKDGVTLSPISGTYILSLGDANVLGTLSGLIGNQGNYIEWRKLFAEKNYWNYTGYQTNISDTGKFGGTFDPGTYRPIVTSYLDGANRTFIGPECVVPTTGVVTCNIAIPSNLLKFRIKKSDGEVQTNAYAITSLVVSNQFGLEMRNNANRVTGYFEIPHVDGKYRTIVYDSVGTNSKEYTYDVISNVVSNFKDSATNQVITPTNGAFELAFSAPNIKGSIQDPSGNNFIQPEKGVWLTLQRFESGNWNWVKNIWQTSTQWEMRIDQAGTYRIHVNPGEYTAFSETYSESFYVNSSLEVSTSENSGFVSTLENFNIRVRENNFNFRVLNPIDDKPVIWADIYFAKKNLQGNYNHYGHSWVSDKSGSIAGKYLEAGEYQITVNAEGEFLDDKTYTATVNSSSVVELFLNGTLQSKADGRFSLSPHKANITGRVFNSEGVAVKNDVGWISVELQQRSEDGSQWSSVRGSSVSNDGFFGMKFNGAGTFRLAATPFYRADVGYTVTESFEITQSASENFTKEFPRLIMNAPNLKVSIGVSDSSTALKDVGVSIIKVIQKEDSNQSWWQNWTSTGSTGLAAFYLPTAGKYRLVVYPDQASRDAGFTKREFEVVATSDAQGKISAVVTVGSGVFPGSGATRLVLGTSNIRGKVTELNSTVGVSSSSVLPIRIEGNQLTEMWDLSEGTDGSGNFALNLPEGTYKLRARAPWNSYTAADSSLSGEIIVGANGVVSSVPAGKSALSFNMELRTPTWSGVVKNPAGTQVVPNANVCLNYRYLPNAFTSNCSYTDSLGRFALSLPDGITLDADSSLSLFGISEYPTKNLRGRTDIEAFLGAPGSGKVLLFPSANIRINVTSNGNPVPNLGVGIQQSNQWGSNSNTNSNGIAEFYSSNPTEPMVVDVGVYYEQSALNAQYVSTRKNFSTSDITNGTSGGIFTGNVPLSTPNIKAVYRLPTVNGQQGALIPRGWVSIYDRDTYEWVTWSNVARDGSLALFLKGGCCDSKRYSLIIDPGNATIDGVEVNRREYDVEVSTSNVATIKDRATGNLVTTEVVSGVTVFTLTAGTPNVRGSVVDPSGNPARYVGVQIDGNCEQFCYPWTDNNGEFKVTLPNGEFAAQTSPWGNSTNFARSARCAFEVTNNAVKTPGESCVQSDGKIRLALRAPNFSFTLKNSGVPITGAHVSISIGGFYTYAQPDQTGRVNFFIDDQLIAEQSQNWGTTTFKPRIYVYPYNQVNGEVEWSCEAGDQKPICSRLDPYTIGTAWSPLHLGDVQVLTSNVNIQIIRPDNNQAVGEYAYAELIRIDRGQEEWAGWGRTNSQGVAGFFIETGTAMIGAKYKVRVIPPWQQRSQLSARVHHNNSQGYSVSELNTLQFALGAPNLKLTVLLPNGSTPNKWGWSYIEELDSENRRVNWVDSNSFDEFGKTSYLLGPDKRFRLVSHPSSGKSGATTSCLMTTDSASVISLVSGGCGTNTINSAGELTITLARGNVVGTVFAADGITPVAGAIIYANIVNAGDEKMAVTSCTLANGTYGVNLDPNYDWIIKVFPVNKPGTTQLDNKIDTPAFRPPSVGSSAPLNITLAVKQQ